MNKYNKKSGVVAALLSLVFSIMLPSALFAAGPATVNLRTASNFAVLAKSGISTTGTTKVVGDMGVSPVSATHITGFGLILPVSSPFSTSPLVSGKVYAPDYADPTSTNLTTAVLDMQTAYNDAVGRVNPTATELGAGNIGGLTIAPGLYKWGTSVIVSSDVTLSGGPDDIWIFQVAQTLTLSSNTKINLSGGARVNNIFWVVTGQTTIGTGAVFNGNILDQTAIVLSTGATLNGRALAQTAVTLDANAITVPAVPVVAVPMSTSVVSVKNPLTYTVTTDKKIYTQDEDVKITISALNSNSESQTLNFTDGCQVSYKVGTYDSSAHTMCTKALTSVVIPANSSKEWTLTHRSSDYKIPVGEQRLVAKVAGQGEASVMVTVTASNPTLTVPQKQFFLNVISPNGGEVWKIGEKKTVQVNITGAPANSYLQISLVSGPTPINVKGQLNPNGNISFDYVLPKNGCFTDMCFDIKAGSYKIEAVLYDKTPCNMRADCVQEKRLAYDMSDMPFSVSANTVIPVPMVTTLPPDTVVSSSQPSSKPLSCPAGKKLLCTPGMLKPDGTNTSTCVCVASIQPILNQSNFGQQVKAIVKNLVKGVRGNDVKELQQFLISQDKGSAARSLSGAGATSYFGSLTRSALAEFQASVGITPAIGNFGPKTRAYINGQF
jgi:Ice-binding-like/Intracellular proteinase inhibitor/Putative peptidoglycan binding domain